MFDHFVITRFNLKLESHFLKDKNGSSTQTDAWLNQRFDLFENFCFPSLYAQSCKQFKWLVLFDIETPNIYIKKIEAYKKSFPNFYPLYLKSGESQYMRQCLNDAIISLSNTNIQYIITSRIDNDDAFHKDMIKEVQVFFTEKKEVGFLNFNYGIQYDLNKRCAGKIRYENNHFLSRLEKKSKFETVIIYDHTQVDNIDKVIAIENKTNPLWIEVIHNSNVGNTMRLSMPIFSSRYLNQFSLKLAIDKKKCFLILLKFIKKLVYEFWAVIFTKLGLFTLYKRLITLWK